MFLAPLAQRLHSGFGHKGYGFTFSWSGDGRPLFVVQGIPEALRLAIKDEKQVLVDIAADPELVDFTLCLTPVNHGQLRQRSPSDRHGFAGDHLVYQFVLVEQGDGICTGLITISKPGHHDLVVGFRFLSWSIAAVWQFQQGGIVR